MNHSLLAMQFNENVKKHLWPSEKTKLLTIQTLGTYTLGEKWYYDVGINV